MLQVKGCSNGPSWVSTEIHPSGEMYLLQGWKAFARSRNLKRGRQVLFKFNGLDTLFVKVFDEDEACKGCCKDSISSKDNDSDDEEDDSSDGNDDSSVQISGTQSPYGSA